MYKNRCWMPFILYPPDMYDLDTLTSALELERSLRLDDDGADFVLYLSVPYCRVRCKACPYFIALLPTTGEREDDAFERYIDHLILDLKRHARARRWSTARLRGVYIGGGTGSLLTTRHLSKVLEVVATHFQLTEDYEITLEGNAEDYTPDKAKFIANSLVNRISLGAQSFQADVLRIVGSPQKVGETEAAVRMLQDAGVENIQLDMMYNMPGHTLSHWEKDFETLRALGVRHLTTYLYRVTPGTQQERLILAGKAPLVASPDSEMVEEMRRTIRMLAEDLGMTNYMHEHFAHPGCESRYNHWTMKECVDALGIGAGAYSFINQRRTGTSKDILRYLAAVASGASTFTTAGPISTPEISRQRYIIFNLLYFQIDKDRYRQKWGSEIVHDFSDVVAKLFNTGLAVDRPDSIQLTDLGKTWLQNVMLEFFDDGMWENSTALQQHSSSWAMNDHMIALSSSQKDFWLERA